MSSITSWTIEQAHKILDYLKNFNFEKYLQKCERFQMPDKRCTFPFMSSEYEYCWDYAEFIEGKLRNKQGIIRTQKKLIQAKCTSCPWWNARKCK